MSRCRRGLRRFGLASLIVPLVSWRELYRHTALVRGSKEDKGDKEPESKTEDGLQSSKPEGIKVEVNGGHSEVPQAGQDYICAKCNLRR